MKFLRNIVYSSICLWGMFFSHHGVAVPTIVSELELGSAIPGKNVLIDSDVAFLITLAAEDDDGQFTISWDAINTASHYEYRLCNNGVCGRWRSTMSSNADFSLSLSGHYNVEVRACDASGCGEVRRSKPINVTVASSNAAEPQAEPSPYTLGMHGGIPSVNPTSETVGATGGHFRVSESGQANYSIPIFTPEGRAGVKPEIALGYTSQPGEGTVGLGWQISGRSSIDRCRQTKELDNSEVAINLSLSDRFCLDGKRLMLEWGTYGIEGSTYRLEIDDQTRVTAIGSQGNGPASFRVSRKDGSTSYYGATNNSQLRANIVSSITAQGVVSTSLSNTVSSWSINQIVDNEGLANPNTINYVYQENEQAGELYLTEVNYSPQNSIKFSYLNRDTTKSIRRFVFGGIRQVTQYLDSISVSDSGTKLRTYQLEYQSNSENVKSYPLKLVNVTESAQKMVNNQSVSVSMPATTFEWLGVNPLGFEESNNKTSLGSQIIGNWNVGNLILNGNYRVGDVNGDRFQDLVYARKLPLTGAIVFETLLSKGTNADVVGGSFDVLSCKIDIGAQLPSDKSFSWSLIDYNDDGLNDLFTTDYISTNNYDVRVYLGQANGCFSTTDIVSNINTTNPDVTVVADFNADGVADLRTGTAIFFARRTGNSAQPYSWSNQRTVNVVGLPSFSDDRWTYTEHLNYGKINIADFNGDGKADSVVHQEVTRFCYEPPCSGSGGIIHDERYAIVSEGEGSFNRYASITSNSVLKSDSDKYIEMFVDINNDQLADHVFKNKSDLYWYYRLNSGERFLNEVRLSAMGQSGVPQFYDYNFDGYTDLIYEKFGALYWLSQVSMQSTEWFTTISYPGVNSSSIFMDVNGDGIAEHVVIDMEGNEHSVRVDRPHVNQTARNVIDQIDNGMGVITNIHYQPLTGNFYTEGTHASQLNWGANPACSNSVLNNECSPVFDIRSPSYAVSEVQSSSPTKVNPGAMVGIRYRYGEARMQSKGRGNLGFGWVESTDLQTNIVTKTEYRQDYPYIGSPKKTTVMLGNQLLSEATNTWESHSTSLAGGGMVYLPYLSESVEKGWDLNNKMIAQAISSAEYDNNGNLTTMEVENRTGSVVTTKVSTSNNYYPCHVFDCRFGRLSSTAVTHQANGVPDIINHSSFEYDNSTGLIIADTVQPGDDASLSLTTIYQYDNYGNIVLSRSCSTQVANCQTETKIDENDQYYVNRWSKTLFEDGRFITQTENSFNQVISSVLTRNELGLATTSVGLNGIETHTAYDAFGRAYFSYANNGRWTETSRNWCDNSCPSPAVFYIKTESESGTQAYSYIDALGREIQKAVTAFGGGYNVTTTEFNYRGLPVKVSEPIHMSSPNATPSANSTYVTTTEYDDLSRPVTVINPDSGVTTIVYDGLVTTKNNPLGQLKTDVKDIADRVVQVTDANGHNLNYTYNARGDLLTLEFEGEVQSTMTYDVLGRKLSMIDMDKGGSAGRSWVYQYNAIGEMISQVDAKDQQTLIYRDNQGREVRRTEQSSEGDILADHRWEFDNDDSIGYSAGQLTLEEDLVSGFQKFFEYDSLGRRNSVETIIDGSSYLTSTTYDEFGRVFQMFDAASHLQPNSGIQNEYNGNGYLASVHRTEGAPSVSNRLRLIQAMDPRGNVTQETLGNGVMTTRAYDAASGRLNSIVSSKNNTLAQDLTYVWDNVGNLVQRTDNNSELSSAIVETFSYDKLNRLTYSNHPNETLVMTYHPNGNINTKSHLGTYVYSGICNGIKAGPHAVTQAGGRSYCYDYNGNMTSGDGRVLSYNSNDKLSRVVKAGQSGQHTTEFKYSPSRSRFKRIDASAGKTTTTHYVGNVEIIERSTDNDIVYRRNLGGIIIEGSTDGSEQISYVHSDHIGSTDVITNKQGSALQRFSFNAFGEQRSHKNWKSFTSGPSISLSPHSSAITSRGFTGHEQMDEVGLIHMNGRVYDAKLGRFIQADPHIQAPSNSQSLNRYSYVMNNPLSYTDPTGYFAKKLLRSIAKVPILDAVVRVVLGYYCQACLVAYSAASTYAVTGSVGAAFRSGLIAAANIGVLNSIGTDTFWGVAGSIQNVYANAVVGGVTSYLSGGKFGNGFVSAGVTSAFKSSINKMFGVDADGVPLKKFAPARIAVAGIVGGTTSAITGGKFANGAVTGAFTQAFNGEQRNNADRQENSNWYDELEEVFDYVGVKETNPVEFEFWEKIGPTLSVGIGTEKGLAKALSTFRKSLRPLALNKFRNLQIDTINGGIEGNAKAAIALQAIRSGSRVGGAVGQFAATAGAGAFIYNEVSGANSLVSTLSQTNELMVIMSRGPQIFR